MSIGLNDEQRTLASTIAEWAASADLPELVRASADRGTADFDPVWKQLAELGIPSIAEHGTFLDAAVAVEACARAMVPGPVAPTVAASFVAAVEGVDDGSARVAVALPSGVIWGEGTHVLTGDGVVPFAESPAKAFDLSTRVARSPYTPVTGRALEVAGVLAAAEASGIAHWCLETAVAYAKVREQFGRTIGSFQSIKHLCAEMLERAESATAVAWDAAAAYDDEPEQFRIAATAAAAVALEAAVLNAQACIQVLGGIGFTWEHDAHLYLRRAMALRQMFGGTDAWFVELADQALAGVRRQTRIATDEAAATRAEVRELLAAAGSDRVALAEAGLIAPHWPAPYGRNATPIEQLVIDEEFAAAGIERPDLVIGAWALPPILEKGTDEQRERFVTPTLRGEIEWCQLFSEPGAGSDLASLRTKAVRDGDGWRLTGQKVWTSRGHVSDWGICLARTNPDAPPHKGITYFLVDMKSAGIEVRPLRTLSGDALFNEVFLDDVFVPDDCVVGEVDHGWPLARTTLANERVAISGSSLGVSVELALSLAGDAPGDLVRLRLGENIAAAATSKALGLRSTLRTITGQGPGAESSVQKLVGVAQRQAAAELAFNLLGPDVLVEGEHAAGSINEALVTRCLSIAGGTTQVLRNVVAERILGLPRDS
ncbi:MAG TPA: acyl-CoA dehydrogenase family protein [Nocardioidaceae bacterium]|nr:acyl-CoA dehydrogenase family protein [Nocardioidaceae bacterium]